MTVSLPAMDPIAARRLEEKERRRSDILDAAERVAAAVGVEPLTMEQVGSVPRPASMAS